MHAKGRKLPHGRLGAHAARAYETLHVSFRYKLPAPLAHWVIAEDGVSEVDLVHVDQDFPYAPISG